MKKITKLFVLTLLLCLTAACSQTFEDVNYNSKPQEVVQGRLVMKVGDNSRTLNPSINESMIRLATLKVNGKEIKTWTGSETIITDIENDGDILLPVGNCELELAFYTQYNEVFKVGKCNTKITTGDNVVTFNMQIVSPSGGGKNFTVAMVNVDWKDDCNVDEVKAGLYNIETGNVITFSDDDGKTITCEETEKISSNKYYTYMQTGMPAGQYLFKCELYFQGNLVNTLIDVIKVVNGIGTADGIKVGNLNKFYTVTYQTDGTWNDGFVPTEVRPATAALTLPTADYITNDDCKFLGWYDDDDNKITEIPAGMVKDIVLTSKWKMTCTAEELLEKLENIKVGIYDITVTGTMTESIITSINDSLYDKVNEYGYTKTKNREKLKVNLDLSQTTGLTSIPNRAFGKYQDNGNLDVGLTSLTGIVLPENVTTIKGYAFCGCTNLKSITIPPSVTTIESYAFRLVFDSYAFSTQKYVERVYISDLAAWCNIKVYEQYSNGTYEEKLANPLRNADLYLDGELVEELVIPDGVTSINKFAFIRCKSIKSVVIPASVTFIEDNVFYGCKNLESVTFENTESWWVKTNGISKIDVTNPETNADFLRKNEYKNLHFSTDGGDITATAGDAVSKLSNLATNTTSTVKLTGSITADTISSIAPYLKDETKKVHLDLSETTGLTSIAADAFYNCRSLVSIKLPNSITDIGAHAFDKCPNLADIDIQDGVKTIGHAAFAYCSSLTELIMPDTVTSLGKELQDSICKHYFCDICGVIRVKCGDYGHPIYDDEQYYCYGEDLTLFRGCTKLTTVEFSKNLTYMHGSNYLFAWCSNLTNVTLPDCLTSIGDYAFASCEKLTSLIIPDGVTYIGELAFDNCSVLQNLTVPNSLTYVDSYRTFENCDSLIYNEYNGLCYLGNDDNPYVILVKIKDKTITSLEPHSETRFFYRENIMHNGRLTSLTITKYMDLGEEDESIVNGKWWNYTEAGDYLVSATNLENIYVEDNHPRYLSQDGVLYNKDKTRLIKCPPKSSITSFTVPDSVTHIGDNAFNNCTNLTEVVIPDSVTTFDLRAFEDCTNLKSITIGNGLIRSRGAVFFGCKNLESVYISDLEAWCKVSFTGDVTANPLQGRFYLAAENGVDLYLNGNLVTDLVIPESITEILPYVFNGCRSLKSVTIHGKMTQFSYSFRFCRNLESVTILDGVTSIGAEAFYDCENLANVIIPDSIITIDDMAFYKCVSLTDITIPANVTSIGDSAFEECEKLANVTFEDTSTWYTTDEDDKYDSPQLPMDVTDPEVNASNLKDIYDSIRYWWKK